MTYCGRFAPSPSGRLHQGSLVAGYAALLRCLSRQGSFTVRIEDLDFPRCPAANTPVILTEMALLGMRSDGDPIVQSHQLDDYHQVMDRLIADGTAYFCECTRALMKQRPCPCHSAQVQERLRAADPDHLAIRIELRECLKHYPSFRDNNLGEVTQHSLGHDLATSLVLRRADGIIAYNLAVVVDDHNEHISEVVRGADMLDATFLQLCLYEIMGWTAPEFYHVPLITDSQGNKLSKQNRAPAVLSHCSPHRAFNHTCALLGQMESGASDEVNAALDELYQRAGELALECAAAAAAVHQSRTAQSAQRGRQGRSRFQTPDFNMKAGSEPHTALTNTLIGLGMALGEPARGGGRPLYDLKAMLLPDSGLDADLLMGAMGLECDTPLPRCHTAGAATACAGAARAAAADSAVGGCTGGAAEAAVGGCTGGAAEAAVGGCTGSAADRCAFAASGLAGELERLSGQYAQLMAQSLRRRALAFNTAAMPRTAIVI